MKSKPCVPPGTETIKVKVKVIILFLHFRRRLMIQMTTMTTLMTTMATRQPTTTPMMVELESPGSFLSTTTWIEEVVLD
jgi:hypothetical protein